MDTPFERINGINGQTFIEGTKIKDPSLSMTEHLQELKQIKEELLSEQTKELKEIKQEFNKITNYFKTVKNNSNTIDLTKSEPSSPSKKRKLETFERKDYTCYEKIFNPHTNQFIEKPIKKRINFKKIYDLLEKENFKIYTTNINNKYILEFNLN